MGCKDWQVLVNQEIQEWETRQASNQERSRWRLTLHWGRILLHRGSYHFL